MKKIISFSLYGYCDESFNRRWTGSNYRNPKTTMYVYGALENACIAKKVYPGWTCRFYCDKSIPDSIINKLIDLDSEIVFKDQINGVWEKMFWRYLPAYENDVSAFISRDTDSRLSLREAHAVNEWMDSNKDLHSIRDSYAHIRRMQGGMWGYKGKGLDMEVFNEFLYIKHKNFNKHYGLNQDFLTECVYDPDSIMIHDNDHHFDDESPLKLLRFEDDYIGSGHVGHIADGRKYCKDKLL
jgi:protein O-GlcNAc transferase